ncbi:Polycystin-2 [Chionoecetes opilio]|uniref:Polycystin-2 n=1 Tax=Chionoecetes opilio TaxID=41210 RepID=A0A8J4Y1W0_CHIOP|nr:Polycystin-2 [Chionoecetes opilio]
MLHPTLLRDLEAENMEVSQRSRSSTGNKSRVSQADSGFNTIQPESLLPDTSTETEPTEAHDSPEENDKKGSSSVFRDLPRSLKQTGSWLLFPSPVENKQYVQEDWEAGDHEDDDDDEDAERDDLRVASSITFIFSQCVGWIVCCIFVALCCVVLYAQGSGMPMDYGALWIHIIYVTLCCSVFIMQPLVVIIYTFYKVCVYRWLGCRGCISSCITVPLDQVVDIWNRYQTALQRQVPTTSDTSNEKCKKSSMYYEYFIVIEYNTVLEERQRTRDLRSAHPPSEDYLLKCREKEIRRDKVYSLFRNTLGHLVLLAVLMIITCNVNIYERFTLNTAILASLRNGSCLDSARYLDPCTITNGEFCNQMPNEAFLTFDDIKTKDDWWNWAYTELLALTYSNHDESFSAYNIFCDSNSIIIGQPRLRKYDSSSQECEASKFKIDSNRSMADLLKLGNCFPDYVDEVPHLFSFGSNADKEYEWDAHFLAVTHGQYSQYSFTSHKQFLASSRFGSVLMLYLLQASKWLDNNGTRAIVTEFTLYHPQTNMYTTLNLLAEFPSLSGAEVTTFISSTRIERYEGNSYVIFMLAETFLLAVAMYYLKRAAVYIYTCRFRIWKSVWGMLDVLMTVVSWSYMVCLMLRVQIAEDAMWQFRVAYFQKFVNLKGLTTWDEARNAPHKDFTDHFHLLRCLSLLKYVPRSYHMGLILAGAWKDVKIISGCVLVFLMALMSLGLIWFSTFMWEFRSHTETILTIIKIVMLRLPFLRTLEDNAVGLVPCLGYLYYLLTYIFLYQLMRALYVAAFLYARKTIVDKPGVDVSWNDVTLCLKERYHSLLHRIRRKKKEEENQPADNTPPDFYMAELELQIQQVMSGLESLADALGLIMDRVNKLDDFHSSYSDLQDSEDDNYSYSNDEAWQLEDSESRSSVYNNDEETKWEVLQHQQEQGTRDADCRHETNHSKGARPRPRTEITRGRKVSVDKGINLDAFTDIESCQTEIETLTHKWNSTLGNHSFDLMDDGGTLEKFLKDVSESFDDNFTSFGKYGKTQLRVSTKIHPSHESLNLSHHNSGVTEGTARQKGIHMDSADGSVPRGISSRLCRTQTQGRGKGHVEALDVTCLESDHDDESNG